jgi:Flp pilus assembly protein TadD
MISYIRFRTKTVAFFVSLLTVLVYLPALQNGFVNWDDPLYVSENFNIRALDMNFFKWMFSFQDSLWVPFTRLSHALNYAVWGLNPMGHHLTNVILHGFNTYLVVIVLASLFKHAKFTRPSFVFTHDRPDMKSVLIASGVAGILFGIHPIHVESVAWITERKDVLSGFLLLLSLHYYIKLAHEFKHNKRSFHYVLSIAFYIMAFLSKPIAVTLPVLLIILDIYPLERLSVTSAFTHQRKVLIEKIPFFVLMVIFVLLTLMANQIIRAELPLKSPIPLSERLITAVQAICFYIYKLLIPVELAPFYPFTRGISILNPVMFISLLSVVAITFFCVHSWRRNKMWLSVWMSYIVLLLPVLGIVQIGYYAAADRYMYLPSMGPLFLVGLWIAWLWEKNTGRSRRHMINRTFIMALTLIALTILSTLTIRQIGIWENSLSLWDAELRIYPEDPHALASRGIAYYNRGNFNEALNDFNKSVAIDQDNESAYYHRGLVFLLKGNFKQAVSDFNRTLQLNPYNNEAHQNRSLAYKLAIKSYSQTLMHDPLNIEAYINRGVAYAQTDRADEALQDFNKALAIKPHALIYYNRGLTYHMMGNLQQAEKDFQTAARMGDKKARTRLKSQGLSW